MVLTKKDYMKVQQQYASLAKVKLEDVEKFLQLVLDCNRSLACPELC
jgi:integrase/recombinase XerD